jgi:hypothetical protein
MCNRENVKMCIRWIHTGGLGKMGYFLGIDVMQLSEGIFISHTKYAVEVLKRFGMENNNALKVPKSHSFRF